MSPVRRHTTGTFDLPAKRHLEAVSKDGALKLSDIAKYGAEEAGAYDDIGLEKTDTFDAHLSGRTFRDFIAGLTALQSSTCLTQENVRRAKEPP